MKSIDPNDPRVTTYALGELPEAEHAEFEAQLETSPEAQAEVESVREMGAMLEKDFADELAEHVPTPTEDEPLPKPAPRRWKAAMIASSSIAAVLVIGAVLTLKSIGFGPDFLSSDDPPMLAAVGFDHVTLGEPKFTSGPELEAKVGQSVSMARDAATQIFTDEATETESLVRALPADTSVGSRFGDTTVEALGIVISPDATSPDHLKFRQPAQREWQSYPGQGNPTPAGATRPYITKPDEGNGVSLRSRAKELDRTDRYAVIGHGGYTADLDSEAIAATDPATRKVTVDSGLIVNSGSIQATDSEFEGGTVAIGAGGDIRVHPVGGSKLSVAPAQASQQSNMDAISATAGRTIGVGGTASTREYDNFAFIPIVRPTTTNPLTAGLRSGAEALNEEQIDELIVELRPSAIAMTEAEPAKNESLFGTSLATLPAVQTLGRVAPLLDNAFTDPLAEPLSTFSVDVDSASYTTIRRSLLQEHRVPHPDTVRIEEMVNYFDYPSYAKANWNVEEADGEAPFSINLDSATAPWDESRQVVRIGLRGAEVADTERPPLNLAFLLDVSGSMSSADKLPLMQEALAEFVPQLRRDDKVTIVVYAGSSGEVLAPTAGSDHATIREALEALSAGGSTAGASGITLAYQRARENFVEDGINQVILATDGDFNVGVSDDESLVELVEREAKSGVFLTVLGFGTGNLNDSMLEKITNQGNGQYHYIDRIEEGRRVLVEELTGTLVPIAKDVKVQVEFNPAKVASYRLIGYANRMLEAQDFADDTVDASEIGAGHTVTALYEVLPVENLMQVTEAAAAPDLKYQKPSDEPKVSPFEAREKLLADRGLAMTDSDEWLTVKLRYKKPKEDVSVRVDRPMVLDSGRMADASEDLRFATAVAAFGMSLRGNADVGIWGLKNVLELAKGAANDAPARTEFITMVERAVELTGAGSTAREVKEKLEAIR